MENSEKSRYCKFKHKECPHVIAHHGTPSSEPVEESIWEVINRLAAYDAALPKIDTRQTGFGDYLYKQNTPRTVAESHSTFYVFGGLLALHSCGTCTDTTTKTMESLELLEK